MNNKIIHKTYEFNTDILKYRQPIVVKKYSEDNPTATVFKENCLIMNVDNKSLYFTFVNHKGVIEQRVITSEEYIKGNYEIVLLKEVNCNG